jgi:dihydroorotase
MPEQMSRIVLQNARLLDPAHTMDSLGSVVVSDGRIVSVHLGEVPVPTTDADTVVDLTGNWLLPGLLDLRCALREPGFEHKETIASGLCAAAAGGFTAICNTPDTNPIIDCAAVVAEVREKALHAGGAKLYPVGAATLGLEDDTIAPLGELKTAGCVAASQGEYPIRNARLMRRVLEYASAFELPIFSCPVESTMPGCCDEGLWSTRLGLEGTPGLAEAIGVSRELALAELADTHVHLAKVSTARAMELIKDAKERGVRVTCDVTAHHLTLTSAALHAYNPHTKVWPPLRGEADREALRQALAEGVVDAIVSDHQPHHAEDKLKPFAEVATGASTVETALSLVLDLVHNDVISPLRAVELLSTGPRDIIAVEQVTLETGSVADLTVVHPTASWTPRKETFRSLSHNSPFLGLELRGVATLTMVNGKIVWQRNNQTNQNEKAHT